MNKREYIDIDSCKIYRVENITINDTDIVKLNEVITNIKDSKIGLFYKNELSPFLLCNEYGIYSKKMLEDFIINKNNKLDLYDGVAIYQSNFNFHKKYITFTPAIRTFLRLILNFIESEYMLSIHEESDIVLNDAMNLSDNFILINDSYLISESMINYLNNISYLSNKSKKLLYMVYTNIRNKVIALIDKDSDSSIKLKLVGKNINIIYYTSPASRRYRLNLKLLGEKDLKFDKDDCDLTDKLYIDTHDDMQSIILEMENNRQSLAELKSRETTYAKRITAPRVSLARTSCLGSLYNLNKDDTKIVYTDSIDLLDGPDCEDLIEDESEFIEKSEINIIDNLGYKNKLKL